MSHVEVVADIFVVFALDQCYIMRSPYLDSECIGFKYCKRGGGEVPVGHFRLSQTILRVPVDGQSQLHKPELSQRFVFERSPNYHM